MNKAISVVSGFAKAALVAGSCWLLSACANTAQTVPITVQSYPLGAYVLLQEDGSKGDWIYLGSTPLDISRPLSVSARKITIRVIKEGYFDQVKVWEDKKIKSERKEKGRIFWNPKLVEGGN